MTQYGGRKKFILLLASFFLVVGLVFGAYELFKLKFKADEVNGVPTAPTNVTAVDNADKTAITLNWDDAVDSTATNYRIERSASIWHQFASIATPASAIKTYIDSSVDPGQRYYYRIIGYNATGDSAYSKIVTPTRLEFKDYLAGIGEMETSFTSFQQRHSSDPKYSETSGYINETVDSIPENSVASAWRAYFNTDLVPGTDTFYRISDGGAAGTKQQCFGLKNNDKNGGYSRVLLKTYLDNNIQINPNEYTNGDTIRFVVDKLSYIDDAELVPGALSTTLSMGGPEHDYVAIPNMPSLDSRPDKIDVTSTVAIPGVPGSRVSTFMFSFSIDINNANTLGSKTPGICLDGVHFYIKKAGETDYKTVSVPTEQNHIQNRFLSHSGSNKDNPYYIASNYDDASMAYSEDYLRLPAKYYNPNMKFFVYTARSLSDYRLGLNLDAQNAAYMGETKFAKLLQDHPDWFYEYDQTKLEPPSGDKRDYKAGVQDDALAYKKQKLDGSFLNYVFDDYYQTEYLNNITKQSYVDWWKTEATNTAKKRGFEGLFLDVSAMRSVSYIKKDLSYVCPVEYPETTVNVGGVDKPGCKVYNATIDQSRDLLKQVIPYFKSQGLLVTMNCAGCHLGQESGDKFFDPENTAIGNTATNTPDNLFQEHSFLGIRPRDLLYNANYYRDIEEWNRTVSDMEKVYDINQNLPESQKKIYYVSSLAVNKTTPDPTGTNPKPADLIERIPTQAELNASLDNYDTGWAKHFTASYLMGSNKYTYFSLFYDDWSDGSGATKEYPMDMAILDRLGEAVGKRQVQFEGRVHDFDCATDFSSNCWKDAVNFRLFENGLVVDNADSGEFGDKYQSHTFIMPDNYIDEYGRKYTAGSTITLQKRSGRIFFKISKLDQPSVSISRTLTYKDSTFLSGTADLFATSVKVNDTTATLDISNHTWTASVPLNLGANNISVVSNNPDIASSDPRSITVTRRKIGDANGDNSINKFDFSSLMLNWNKFENANPADFNEDESVGKIDFSMMMLNWGK